jgi:GNAT superfamily N-acetyltransferase
MPVWWDKRDVGELCARLTRVALPHGLNAAGPLPEGAGGVERVGHGMYPDLTYALEYMADDEDDLCELARVEVTGAYRRQGIGTCLYFAFEDWLRGLGCRGVVATGNNEAALLNAKVGFDFDPPELPDDLVALLELPRSHRLRYPFQVASFRTATADGTRELLRRGFTGKRIFDGDPLLETVAQRRRADKGC